MNADCKVLLIDDEELIRLNLYEFLTDEGFSVNSSDSCEEALNLINNNKFNIAVVDMHLPGMDGREFIEKAHSLSPETKFIIHTGSSSFHISEEFKKIGITQENVLLKPLMKITDITKKIYKLTSI